MDEWNKILEKIESDKYSYISFDIFDTLLLRPFWEPTDLFYFVGITAKQLNAAQDELDFMEKRRKAEEKARIKAGRHVEDINLDEIYDTLQNLLKCSGDVIEKLKKREKELELYFCYQRQSGFELYQKAVASNKKIIFISDMYLSEQDIRPILIKNGYDKFKKIYLSSEKRLGKYTGNLYQYVIEDLGNISVERILHIGDNYASDIIMAEKLGLSTAYLMKAKDAYLKNNPIKSERLLTKRIENAILANTTYDNPYMGSHDNSYQEKAREIVDEFSDDILNREISFVYRKPSFSLKIKRRIISLFRGLD